jgi:hypothetical protein
LVIDSMIAEDLGCRINPVLQRPGRKRGMDIMNSDSCKTCSQGDPSRPRVLHHPLGLRAPFWFEGSRFVPEMMKRAPAAMATSCHPAVRGAMANGIDDPCRPKETDLISIGLIDQRQRGAVPNGTEGAARRR